MAKPKMTLIPELAAEAKSLVALAFRNGPDRGCSCGERVPHLRGKIRILAHHAS